VERQACADCARKHAIFDRLEKNMACGFSGMRGFLIAVQPIKNARGVFARCAPGFTLRAVICV